MYTENVGEDTDEGGGKTGTNQKDINLSQQASGNYILQISTTEGKESIKITKK